MRVKYSIGQQQHVSCVFYGTVNVIGNSPFKIIEHEQVKEVFCYIQRCWLSFEEVFSVNLETTHSQGTVVIVFHNSESLFSDHLLS